MRVCFAGLLCGFALRVCSAHWPCAPNLLTGVAQLLCTPALLTDLAHRVYSRALRTGFADRRCRLALRAGFAQPPCTPALLNHLAHRLCSTTLHTGFAERPCSPGLRTGLADRRCGLALRTGFAQLPCAPALLTGFTHRLYSSARTSAWLPARALPQKPFFSYRAGKIAGAPCLLHITGCRSFTPGASRKSAPWNRCLETHNTRTWTAHHRQLSESSRAAPSSIVLSVGALSTAPHSPIGRGSRLKIDSVWVRVPVGGRIGSCTVGFSSRSHPKLIRTYVRIVTQL